jgi:hypothetical protein
MAAPAEIVRLVETFERNNEAYRQGGLNETQLRREFLDSFFKALGWDVDNTQGWAEPSKEVIREDTSSGGRRRRMRRKPSSGRLRRRMGRSISLCTNSTA